MKNMANKSSLVVLGCTATVTALYIILKHFVSQGEDDEKKDIENGVLNLIKRRRSVFPKQYNGDPVPEYVIKSMLEAARWAPTHHLTEPWHFIVYSNSKSRQQVGQFLADNYKIVSTEKGKYSQKKYDKKLKNAESSSHIIAICLHRKPDSKCSEVEEICSVAAAVQNMTLVATEHGVGSYWSSASVFENEKKNERIFANSKAILEFLDLPTKESTCLGWLFVGGCSIDCFRNGIRKPIEDKVEYR